MRWRGILPILALSLLPYRAWPQGQPLGPEFRVNTYTTFDIRASVSADSSGNFVVVWQAYGQDGFFESVSGQRYDSGGVPLGNEFRVNTYTTDSQRYPSVASDAAGNFVVVWASNNQVGVGEDVFAQRFASSGAPLGPEFRVNTHTTSDQAFPTVASGPAGNFVVVWGSFQQDGNNWGVFGQRFTSSGAPLGPEFRVNTYTTGFQGYRPAVAADAAGDFVVVWDGDSQGDPSTGVFGQRYASSGVPLGSEFQVNTYTTGIQFSPRVASDPAGNFVVAWVSWIGQDPDVFGRRYASSGTPIGSEFQINTYTTGYQLYPAVASDAAGNFVVAWQSRFQDGSDKGVFGQRYAGSGAPLGPEFRVNTYTTLDQAHPSVAADASGNFVVVWQSFGQDGSSYGVFGQRYGQIVPVELMRFGVE